MSASDILGDYDVVVFGATPSGIMAAEAAVLSGARTALVEPTGYVGGIWAQGGLTNVDIWYKTSLGGRTWQFWQQLMRSHGVTTPPAFTPAVDAGFPREGVGVHPGKSEALFLRWIERSGCDLYLNAQLDWTAGSARGAVIMSGLNITGIRTARGVIRGKAFVDASYEGDIMAGAGVEYVVGRESSAKYGESLAGFRPTHTYDSLGVSLRNADGTPRYPLADTPTMALGDGDNRTMSTNFRATLSHISVGNVRPFWKPHNFDPSKFELWKEMVIARNPSAFTSCFTAYTLVLNKWNLNNNGSAIPLSVDLPNKSWDYADATPTRRQQIMDENRHWTTGMLWMAANDPDLPAAFRADCAQWGYAADEFSDNQNFPRQMYLREGRRMVGAYVLTQADVQTNKTKIDTVARSVYPIDCHGPHWYIDGTQTVYDGDMYQTNVGIFRIPKRSLTPKVGQCENLLVTVCVSCSHVAWAPLRMEPCFMLMGEAGGIMAALVAKTGTRSQSLDYTTKIAPALQARGAIL